MVNGGNPGDPDPDTGLPLYRIQGPIDVGNDGSVLFSAEVGSFVGPETLFRFRPGIGIERVVSTGDSFPLGGSFDFSAQTFIASAVGDNGDVIFSGRLSNGPFQWALFRESAGTLAKVIADGDPAPFPLTGTLNVGLQSQVRIAGPIVALSPSVANGSTSQVGVIVDLSSGAVKPFAWLDQSTGTALGGAWAAIYEQIPRRDGTVVFRAALDENAVGYPDVEFAVVVWTGSDFEVLANNGTYTTSGLYIENIGSIAVNQWGETLFRAFVGN